MKLLQVTGAIGLVTLTNANIVFHWVQPSCHHSASPLDGCLRGQICTEENKCKAASNWELRNLNTTLSERAVYRDDARCGRGFSGASCDVNGPFGGCCSSHGYCGRSDDHCLVQKGCQNGCQNETASAHGDPSHTSPRDDGRCGRDFGGATCDAHGRYGGCCSASGYCGRSSDHCSFTTSCQSGCHEHQEAATNTAQEPVIGEPTDIPLPPDATGPTTTDGSCGAAFDRLLCGNWHLGSCCSMYGFCGNTTAHCGPGCQSGPCQHSSPSGPGPKPAPPNPRPGNFRVLGDSGVPVMHAALLPNGKVAFIDKVENYTQLRLTNGHYAYAAEYDPDTNTAIPLGMSTNAFCSGGAFGRDGELLVVGGNGPLAFIDDTVGDGFDGIRYIRRSTTDRSLDGQWLEEPGHKLSSARWYPTVQTLANGTFFVASGSLNGLDPSVPSNNNPTYELLDQGGRSVTGAIALDILVENQPYYMYPFIHLLPDSSLFILTSRSSVLWDPATAKTVRTFPEIPGEHRTYPNTGSSVLLPLRHDRNFESEVLVCGGGAYQDSISPTDASCGKFSPAADNANWDMESMPGGRSMLDGILLPDSTILWLNGVERGAQGFGLASMPVKDAWIWDPKQEKGKRWSVAGRSTVGRLYHSVAVMLRDGRVLVGGSNPVEMPRGAEHLGEGGRRMRTTRAEEGEEASQGEGIIGGGSSASGTSQVYASPDEDPATFLTEWRLEIYTPPYLIGNSASLRPTNVKLLTRDLRIAPDQSFEVEFDAPRDARDVEVVLHHGGFVTHSLHMGQRMIVLKTEGWEGSGSSSRRSRRSTRRSKRENVGGEVEDVKEKRDDNAESAPPATRHQKLRVSLPENRNVAPPGPYLVFVVVDGRPSVGEMVMVG